MRRLLGLVLMLCVLPLAAPAQTPADEPAPAVLIADSVRVEGDRLLVAEGNVEVLFDGNRMTAARVTYDRDTDQLTIEGPMRLTSDTGALLTADRAELSADMRDGLLTSARLVLNQQLQLAAAEILRVGGRYSVLEKTVASSCTVCVGEPVPLWQIRARRVVHDAQERQIYFDHARLEVMGLPIFYLPRLRLPDPSLKRANGFLVPTLRVTDGLGAGLKLPYFITLGPYADLTVTPYLSTSRTRTVELRYRREFRAGGIELNGAVSRDDLVRDKTRFYLFGEGAFDLPRDFKLTFGLQTVSDPAYLQDYGYSDLDRLENSIAATRTRRDEYIGAGLHLYKSLRASERNKTLPSLVVEGSWTRRFEPPVIGGVAEAGIEVFGFNRRSTLQADATSPNGRDMTRATGRIDWHRDWTARNGMLFTAQGALALDYYSISDDSLSPGRITRATPFAAATMRWPLVKAMPGGATQVLEPVAQLVWSRSDTGKIPNEDSRSVEFDEGNLFSLSRFSGSDAREQGLRANLGVSWTRYDPSGWSLGMTVGRILRATDQRQFPASTGMNGTSSDWLAALRLEMGSNLDLINRAVFDDSFNFTRNELRVDWRTDKLSLASSYLWQEASLFEDRPDDSSEWLVDAAYRLRGNWTGKADWRYDFVAGRAARAGLGLEYRNECVTVDLSLSRRYASSTSVRTTTDFGLTISLTGFGNTADASAYRRSCAR